jgi:cystathionine gamma-synthase
LTAFSIDDASSSRRDDATSLLEEHAAVANVFYPGLESHPGYKIASKQQTGFGGMLSFEFAAGQDAARAFLENVELFTLAKLLGGVESLACHPATATHATHKK